MSNLIKSGFVAFSQNDKLVIDANENRIIKAIDEKAEEERIIAKASREEVLAEALIRDAELNDLEFDDDMSDMEALSSLGASLGQEEAEQRAEEILKTAQKDADEIISMAHDEVEKLRAVAYDEAEQIKQQAKDEGYQIGYAQAMEAAQSEISQKEAILEQKLQEVELDLQERERELVKDTENQMVEILCQLIPTITGVVIENQKDVLLYMINTAMQDLDNSKKFIIKVSSNDYEELVERKDEIYGALNPAIEMEIYEDAKLGSMQCMIETDNGIVDVSLDVQLDNLITALKLMTKE